MVLFNETEERPRPNLRHRRKVIGSNSGEALTHGSLDEEIRGRIARGLLPSLPSPASGLRVNASPSEAMASGFMKLADELLQAELEVVADMPRIDVALALTIAYAGHHKQRKNVAFMRASEAAHAAIRREQAVLIDDRPTV